MMFPLDTGLVYLLTNGVALTLTDVYNPFQHALPIFLLHLFGIFVLSDLHLKFSILFFLFTKLEAMGLT